MKKLYLMLIFSLALILCLSVSAMAANVEIEADDTSDIISAISNAAVGDSITVNLTNDVIINKDARIEIKKDITLTINLNGYILFGNCGGGSGGEAYAILVYSSNAKLILNGSTVINDFKSNDLLVDQEVTVSNGQVVDPNKDTGVRAPDFPSTGPAIVQRCGTVELNNMYVRCYNGDEWAFLIFPTAVNNFLETNVKLDSTILRTPDTSQYGGIGTRGSASPSKTLVEIENSIIYGVDGNRAEHLSLSLGSYVRNTRFAKKIVRIDGYLADNRPTSEPAVFENVVFENTVYSCTGTIYINLIDCSFPNGMKINAKGDSKGSTKVFITQSATCTEPGKQVSITVSNAAEKILTSLADFTDVNEQYSIDNPAKGHTANLDEILDLVYENGFINAGTYICTCTECGATDIKEKTPSASALITFVGISAPMNGNGICIGYAIDREAIETYKSYEKTFEYGVVAYIPLENETNVDPIGTDLKPIDYTISAPLSAEYSAVDFVINGFGSHVDTPLAMCAYVYDGSEVDYLNASISETVSISQDDYVSTITLASVLAYAKSFE